MSVAAYRNEEAGKANMEIFLRERQMEVDFGSGQSLDPNTFPKSHTNIDGVPFKYAEENSQSALEGYAHAFLTGRVSDKPKYLISVSMDLHEFDNCIQDGSIQIHASTKTVKFMSPMIVANYPTMQFLAKGHETAIAKAFEEMRRRVSENGGAKRRRGS